MGFFGEDHYNQFQDFDGSEDHKAKFSHEVLGGAAAFAAAKGTQYEDHRRKEGEPTSHAHAKEILAGIAGGLVDRFAETKGLDFVDREKAKHHAEQQSFQQFGYN